MYSAGIAIASSIPRRFVGSPTRRKCSCFEGDHSHRLTHTLEVTQIARPCTGAGVDEDLRRRRWRDLGHPPLVMPVSALDRCLADCGGFDHNAQSLRVVTALERPYPEFDGLNLSWETLEGLVKHNGPLVLRDGSPALRYRERGIPPAIEHYVKVHDLKLCTFPGLEAQIAAIADDIAYNAHDIDDGLRAHFFRLEELAAIPLLSEILQELKAQYGQVDSAHFTHELLRRMITTMIEDVIAATRRRLNALSAGSTDAIREADGPIGAFSSSMAEADRNIKVFLSPRLYRHARIVRIMTDAEQVVTDLFRRYARDPAGLPAEWAHTTARSPSVRVCAVLLISSRA
jgi:dGTPase